MSKFVRLVKVVSSSFKNYEMPKSVNYEITSKCNLKCEHCYWWKNHDAAKELSDKQWEKVFIEHRKKGVSSGHLTGGEPALRMNVIRAAYRIFNNITLVSNGTIKIPPDINQRIFVSIDGPKEIHDKIRGAKIFDKVIKNVTNDKRVVLGATLTTTNYKYVEDMVRIARKANVDGITFSTYVSHSGPGDPLLLKGKELDWTINKLKELRKKNKDILFMTTKMIELWRNKEHHKKCFMRNPKSFMSFDYAMKKKLPCVIGEGVNCETCGCVVPVMHHVLLKADPKTWLLFDKMCPERLIKSSNQDSS